jgi:hypothetical protein
VIAFAPAAFGIAATRPPGVAADRLRRYAELTAAPRLRALIFGFAEDAYETADDCARSRRVRGRVRRDPAARAGRPALRDAPHCTVRDPASPRRKPSASGLHRRAHRGRQAGA